MAKIKVKIVENSRVGTHSFYAIPQWAGTLSTEEILEEALDGKSIEPSVAKAAIETGVARSHNMTPTDVAAHTRALLAGMNRKQQVSA
jgi:hypothetical protein